MQIYIKNHNFILNRCFFESGGKPAYTGQNIEILQPLPGFFTSFKNDRQKCNAIENRNSPLPSFLSGGKHT